MSPSDKTQKQTVRERIEEFLLDPANAGSSNAEISKALGINAASVRRARTPDKGASLADALDEMAELRERNEQLEAQIKQLNEDIEKYQSDLKRYKANAPKPSKHHDPGQPMFKAIRELIHGDL